MAKELPYFKFEPMQWDNGNIQACTREDKGLFIDLCSMYWARLGDVSLKLAAQKLCAGNATAFDSLISDGIFEVIDGLICISFLNEQLNEFEDLSNTNRKNALEGWEKRRKQKEESERNATALKSQSETDAIREEKIKENKKKEDIKFNFKKSLLDLGIKENLVNDWLIVRKNKKLSNTETAFNSIKNEIEKTKLSFEEIITICVENSWGGFKENWLNNLKNNNGTNNKGASGELKSDKDVHTTDFSGYNDPLRRNDKEL